MYDPEIEKERLAFEQRKWEAEIEERKHREEILEQQKWAVEQEQRRIELEERKRKEEIEMDERKQRWEAEQEQRRFELELRTRELQRQEARDKIEDQRKASAVVKGKLFGDVCHSDGRGSHRSHCIFPQRRTVVFCL